MATFNFYCRASKCDQKGLAPIELSIIINKKRTFISLPKRLKPSEFQKDMRSRRTNDTLEYIELLRHRINAGITDIERNGMVLTTETLKNYIKYGGLKHYTVGQLFQDCLSLVKDRTTPSNFHKYELVREDFFAVLGPDKQVEEITNAVIQAFFNYAYKNFKPSTAAGKLAKLKYVIKFALDNDKLRINPFGSMRISKPRPNIEYLTDAEVEVIKAHHFGERLEQVKDCFLFQCGSGLSYSDMAQVKREDIQTNGDTKFIIKNRQKTKVEFTSVLLPWAIEVLDKYNGMLPVITNQKMNEYLKEIGTICGLDKRLHSHLARKTYATHLLCSGVRMEVVSKCCGHSNTKTTAAIYAHLQTQNIINEVSKIL